MKNFCGCCLFVVPFLVHGQWTKLPMDHCVFRFATRGQCIKEKKLDCFEHNSIFCFKLQCASIVVLLCTAIWWKLKDTVVHLDSQTGLTSTLGIYQDVYALNSWPLSTLWRRFQVFIFTLCWSWAPVAYIEFPGTEIPSFYPAFQILNSFMGFFVFVCIGLGSRKFRTEIKRQIDSHKVHTCN